MTALDRNEPAAAPPSTSIGALTSGRGRLALVGHALPWAIIIIFYFTAGGYLSLGTQVLIWILFALSLLLPRKRRVSASS